MRFPNSEVDNFVIQLEERYTPFETAYGDFFVRPVLMIECYGNTFFKGEVHGLSEASLSVQIKNNNYVFIDSLSDFQLECCDFIFKKPTEPW